MHVTAEGTVTGQKVKGALHSAAALTRAATHNAELWPALIAKLKGHVTRHDMASVWKAVGGGGSSVLGAASAEPPVTPGILTAAFGDLARNFAIVFEGTLGESPEDFVDCVRVTGGHGCGSV